MIKLYIFIVIEDVFLAYYLISMIINSLFKKMFSLIRDCSTNCLAYHARFHLNWPLQIVNFLGAIVTNQHQLDSLK